RGDPFIAFSVPQLFNIERVEVLKGPSGMLYGPSSPGGMLNYVTRTPRDVFSGEASVVVGGRDRRGVSAEITGPVTSDVSARAGAFFEQKDSFRRNASSKSFIGDLGVAYRPTDTLDLLLQFTAYDQRLPGNRLRGVP